MKRIVKKRKSQPLAKANEEENGKAKTISFNGG
jgi:hypothetical protein